MIDKKVLSQYNRWPKTPLGLTEESLEDSAAGLVVDLL